MLLSNTVKALLLPVLTVLIWLHPLRIGLTRSYKIKIFFKKLVEIISINIRSKTNLIGKIKKDLLTKQKLNFCFVNFFLQTSDNSTLWSSIKIFSIFKCEISFFKKTPIWPSTNWKVCCACWILKTQLSALQFHFRSLKAYYVITGKIAVISNYIFNILLSLEKL